jgi:hypothetical protein
MRARRAQTPLVPRPVFSEVRWAEPPSLRRESADAEPRRARYRLAIRDAVPTRQTVIKLPAYVPAHFSVEYSFSD